MPWGFSSKRGRLAFETCRTANSAISEIGIALATEPKLLWPRRADRRHEPGETEETKRLVRRRQESHHSDRRARHAGCDGASAAASCRTPLWRYTRRRRTPEEIQKNPRVLEGLSQDSARRLGGKQSHPSSGSRMCTLYGKSHILHGVSLKVDPGEVVGLLGHSGVGKSTTLKTIMGLGSAEPRHGAARTALPLAGCRRIARAPRHRLCAGRPPYLPPAAPSWRTCAPDSTARA